MGYPFIMKHAVIRDSDFKKVARVRVDAKKRIGIPKAASQQKVDSYELYVNETGQIVLDPQVTIPAAEVWLYKNPKALTMVREGLQEAKSGKTIKGKSFSKHADDSIQ